MHIGLADFAEPTLLLLGDAASLRWLAECLESRQSLDFAVTPLVKQVNVNLFLDPVEENGDLSRNNAKFAWKVSSSEAHTFAAQLCALAASEVPAHAYLDSKLNSSGVQIVVSKDEYSADDVFVKE